MEAIRDLLRGLVAEEEEQPQKPSSTRVTLHVYDFLEQGLNGMLRQVGTGGFHCGVEVYGKEWSFRRTVLGSGIYWIWPKTCKAHKYRESVPMGKINMTEESFLKFINKLKREWPGSSYDILRRNCCVFSDHLCQKLGVGPIPDWITNLAGVGADLRSVVRRPLRQMEEAVFGEEPSHRDRASKPAAPAPAPGPGRPPTARRGGYEKLPLATPSTSGRGKTRLKGWRKYCAGGCLVTLFVSLCVFAGLAGAGRLHLPWNTSQGDQAAQPSAAPVAPAATPAAPVLTPAPFDCSTGADTWAVSWSLTQSMWCCQNAGRGCPGANSSVYDCEAGEADDPAQQKGWPVAKREWCCLHRGVGCGGNSSSAAAEGVGAPGIGIGVGIATAGGHQSNATSGRAAGGGGNATDDGAGNASFLDVELPIVAGPVVDDTTAEGMGWAPLSPATWPPVPAPMPTDSVLPPPPPAVPERPPVASTGMVEPPETAPPPPPGRARPEPEWSSGLAGTERAPELRSRGRHAGHGHHDAASGTSRSGGDGEGARSGSGGHGRLEGSGGSSERGTLDGAHDSHSGPADSGSSAN